MGWGQILCPHLWVHYIQEGIQKGIAAMVSTLRELKVEDDIIVGKIREKFDLTEETAEMYMK